MKNKNGFTLIETVISVAIIAIVMYALIAIFITSGTKGMNVEVFTVAQSLAEGKLEQAMAQDFGEVTSESETNFTGDLSAYSYEILVDHVSAEVLDSPVGYATDYKRIEVRIRRSLLDSPTKLKSLRSNY